MALLVLRVEGFDDAEASLGSESANVLRRKVAVRLRAAVRASDVVAALSADSFALLLASTEEPLDAELVARKLLDALHQTPHRKVATITASLTGIRQRDTGHGQGHVGRGGAMWPRPAMRSWWCCHGTVLAPRPASSPTCSTSH